MRDQGKEERADEHAGRREQPDCQCLLAQLLQVERQRCLEDETRDEDDEDELGRDLEGVGRLDHGDGEPEDDEGDAVREREPVGDERDERSRRDEEDEQLDRAERRVARHRRRNRPCRSVASAAADRRRPLRRRMPSISSR